MQHHYTWKDTLDAAQRVNWRIEDLIGGEKQLDFAKPFLPESLARTRALGFLDEPEQRTLNQIRGHAYLSIFGLVEEFILPFVLDHARPQLSGDDWRIRALLQFASEEAKHIHLFKRFRDAFEDGFGGRCAVIGPPEAVAARVLGHSPLAVALVILHIEWMTQRHYVESVRDDDGRDNGDLDPRFASLLRHHWMEEAQHARLDTLMVEAIAAGCDEAAIDRAVDEYLQIGLFLDEGLKQQTEFDRISFETATGRTLSDAERRTFQAVQHQANRWSYLGSGMTHPRFLATVATIRPGAERRIAAVAPAFC